MTLQDRILRYLEPSQSTASNLALALGKPQEAVQSVLDRMEREGIVVRFTIQGGRFTVWDIPRGRKPTVDIPRGRKAEPCSSASLAQSSIEAARKRPTPKRKSDTPTQK